MKKIITTLPDPPWDDNVTHNLQIKYIMTPQEEEAKELVEKMANINTLSIYDYRLQVAKQCALIAVEKIIEVLEDFSGYHYGVAETCDFYKDVKSEIEKL